MKIQRLQLWWHKRAAYCRRWLARLLLRLAAFLQSGARRLDPSADSTFSPGSVRHTWHSRDRHGWH